MNNLPLPNMTTEDILKTKIIQDEAESGDDSDTKPTRRSGRRKIKIEYIEDKNRRHITFSKRKAGIMKKAYELSTLTGTQVLLLVVSETGLVYTLLTVKLQPIVTKPEGKNLIQACLNAPDPIQPGETNEADSPAYKTNSNNSNNARSEMDNKKVNATFKDKKVEPTQQSTAASVAPSNYSNNNSPYQPPSNYHPIPTPTPTTSTGPSMMPPMNSNNASNYGHHPNYMNTPYHPSQASPPQHHSPQQPSYGMSGPPYYGNQQPMTYMQGPPNPQSYWSTPNHPLREDDKTRRSVPSKK